MTSEDTTPLNSFRKGVEGIGDLALQGLDQTKLLIHKANPTVGKKVDEVEEVILTARKEFTEKGFWCGTPKRSSNSWLAKLCQPLPKARRTPVVVPHVIR